MFELHRYQTSRNRYRAGPAPSVPAVSGPVPAGSVNPVVRVADLINHLLYLHVKHVCKLT
jgi:hypothetical protein